MPLSSTQERVEDLARRLTQLTSKDYTRILTAWLLATPKERDEIASILELEYRRLTKAQEVLWLDAVPQDESQGNLELGTVACHDRALYPFRMNTEALLRHVTIFGQAGSGKTNLGYLLLQNLLTKGVPFVVLDWKRNYRDLLALLPPGERGAITVYTVGRHVRPFTINPLIPPPGTSPETWLKKITEIIARAAYVGEGVMSILHRGIDAVYESFGVYRGTPERWPTLDDVRRWIEDYVQHASTKDLKPQWVASTHRTLQSLCYGDMARVVNVDQPTPIQELLRQPVILELDALAEAEKTLIVETLLLWIHHYRLQEPERETLKHVILIEEAHHVLRREELTARESILDVVIREIRELGEGLIMIDQSPSQFSHNAIGNSATSFVFALKDRADVMTASNFLLLDTDQKTYLNLLPVGTAIVKRQDGYRKPFLITLPHVRVPKGSIRDQDLTSPAALASELPDAADLPQPLAKDVQNLQQAVRELATTTTELRKQAASVSPSGSSRPFPPTQAKPSAERVSSRMAKIRAHLDDLAVHFLRDILEHPESGISSRYERLRVSTKNGNRVKERLEQDGVITITPVNKGDSQLKLINLTPLGKRLVEAIMPDWRITKALRGSNGAEHRYWKHRVAAALEDAGLRVATEKPINGDRVDVHVENGDRTAIEVETGKSDIAHNIDKDLRAGYKDVLILPTNPRARRKVNRLLARRGTSRAP